MSSSTAGDTPEATRKPADGDGLRLLGSRNWPVGQEKKDGLEKDRQERESWKQELEELSGIRWIC